jgi:3-deoxy-manno-octulosonate cytidylyltransferase (CMP-KDO synthetase)
MAIGIIPARFASTRFPGKPLADICGKPLLQHVFESVSTSKLLSRIAIATDDSRIAEAAHNFGAEVIMTDSDLPSGTDRIFQAYLQMKTEGDIIVNIQGDEPLFSGHLADELISRLSASEADVATMVKKITSVEDLFNPSNVKAVVGNNGYALYFSRNTLPFVRDQKPIDWIKVHDFYKHVGVYAYKASALKRFVALPVSKLESLEQLEQLRLMEDGARYLCVETEIELVGVDTPQDVQRVEKILIRRN